MDSILSQMLGSSNQALPNPVSLYDQINKLNQNQIQAQQDRIGVLGNILGQYQNYDPVNQAYAAALLRPTRTGSFLESLGNAAEAQSGVLSQLQKEKLDREEKIASLQNAQLQLALDAPYKLARASRLTQYGTGQGTPNSRMQALKIELQALQNSSDEALAAQGVDRDLETAAILAEMANVRSQMSGKKTGSAEGDDTDTGSGGSPEVKNQDDYSKIGAGQTFMYKGKMYKKPDAPADQPRG